MSKSVEQSIEYDTTLGEYVATAMTGMEVFGQTRQECHRRLREANRVYIAQSQKNQEERDGN